MTDKIRSFMQEYGLSGWGGLENKNRVEYHIRKSAKWGTFPVLRINKKFDKEDYVIDSWIERCKLKIERKIEKLEKDKLKGKVTKKKSTVKDLSYYKGKLDTVFQKFIRYRDGIRYSGNPKIGKCISCGKECSGRNFQAGHFIVREKMNTRRDEMNVHGQCGRPCNLDLSGNTIEYEDELIRRFGKKKVEALKRKGRKLKNRKVYEVIEMIDHYKNEIKLMEEKLKKQSLF